MWLIDWEYSDRRQVGYDALVFMLRARFPRGLADRLQDFVSRGIGGTGPMDVSTWPGGDWDAVERRRLSAALFLLEELALHLEENANSYFLQIGRGLAILSMEIISKAN